MESYLTDRQNYVFYNGYRSVNFTTTSGVPQGSNLGPLLFIIFIDDLLTSIRCHCLAYADDLKIYRSINGPGDAECLQHDLNTLVTWCGLNGLLLNVDKCCCVSFSRRRTLIETSYSLDNSLLMKKRSIKDLGVVFDEELTFGEQVESVCSTASRSLGFVMRTSRLFTDTRVLRSLYSAFVLSKLDYAAVVWYPLYMCQKIPIDRIHRKFLKFLSFKLDGMYPERGVDTHDLLRRHSLPSMSSRRDRQCSAFLQRLIAGRIDCDRLLSAIDFYVPRQSSRYVSSFLVPRPRTNVLRRAPVSVMCRCANECVSDIFC